ncbi:cupin domain-containing protein [Haliea sp. E1-2-M8]|uniref:cupin domain-containing protein n=1 Tax=Haliea sp. E1-2-M8 TaxID=3064706 RepID=UPI00271C1511|nr:cupin domain-containing protein [Haliea sp. E1-2-M8]MDO8860271.1 cupin domain-containing protein [Haliea sp. E1-2-M8]
MNDSSVALNGDLSLHVVVDTQTLDWTPSPGGHVLRKRLHRVGQAESGQVTSLVRYEPGARFPAHDHPQGEEILVLEGTFSDEHGDWPAGTYLLNPEGFRHAPFSSDGCLLFVKLRQYPGADREHVVVATGSRPWQPSVRKNTSWKKLYAQEPYTDFMRLESWDTPAAIGQINFPQGAEILVLKGSFSDDRGHYRTHCWLRIPAGGSVHPTSNEYCELYIKEGGFSYLRSAPLAATG